MNGLRLWHAKGPLVLVPQLLHRLDLQLNIKIYFIKNACPYFRRIQ